MGEPLRYRLLGPVEVIVDGRRLPIQRPRQRAVLAYLLLQANRLVTTDRLVEAIWGGTAPRTARTQVQTDLSIIRGVLREATGHDPVTTKPSGYQIACRPGQLDLDEFERLSRAAMAGPAPDRDQGVLALREALDLWRGDALADVRAAYRDSFRAPLEEQRLRAYEDLLSWELDRGRPVAVVPELTRLVAGHPTHERFTGLLMLALYRGGRPIEALEVARSLRRRLADEFGLDPGPDLSALEHAILCNDPDLRQPPLPGPTDPLPPLAASPAPAQLPPDIAGFVGRADDLAQLDATMAADDTGPAAIVAVFGPAGVGKTALAVHWGHSRDDMFPDGQFYVDLRGHSTDPPVAPEEALTYLLRAIGTPVERLPLGLENLTNAFRTWSARRRVLIIADNAHHVDQVRRLLPVGPGSLCLVTSRYQLGGLVAVDAAVPMTLAVLREADAEALLAHVIGPERAAADPAAIAGIAAACGHLPLALRIAAAQLVLHPHLTPARLVDRLRTGDRLAALDLAEDRRSSVRGAFDATYLGLPEDVRIMFRRLGLVPGVTISAAGAAALADVSDATGGTQLAGLAAAHLVDEVGEQRYALHDLLREYARQRASTEDSQAVREGAIDRLLAWQVSTADVASRTVCPSDMRLELPAELRVRPLSFADRGDALAWLDAERPNLLATVDFAAGAGREPIAWLTVDLLRGYLRRGGYLTEWIAVARTAASAARRSEHPAAEAISEFGLAVAHQTAGAPVEAAAHYLAARDAARRVAWTEVEAGAVGGLGSVALQTGNMAAAVRYLTRAVELARTAGATSTEAVSLGNLAMVSQSTGRLSEAAAALAAVVPLFRAIGSTHGEAMAASNLAGVCLQLGRPEAAVEYGTRALTLFREIGDCLAASVLAKIARARIDQGQAADGLVLAEAARRDARTAGYRSVESDCLLAMAQAARRLGDDALALDSAEEALRLALDVDSVEHSVLARLEVAEVHLTARRLDQARDHAGTARRLAREHELHGHECSALTVLAEAEFADARWETATRLAREARARAVAVEMRPVADRADLILRLVAVGPD